MKIISSKKEQWNFRRKLFKALQNPIDRVARVAISIIMMSFFNYMFSLSARKVTSGSGVFIDFDKVDGFFLTQVDLVNSVIFGTMCCLIVIESVYILSEVLLFIDLKKYGFKGKFESVTDILFEFLVIAIVIYSIFAFGAFITIDIFYSFTRDEVKIIGIIVVILFSISSLFLISRKTKKSIKFGAFETFMAYFIWFVIVVSTLALAEENSNAFFDTKLELDFKDSGLILLSQRYRDPEELSISISSDKKGIVLYNYEDLSWRQFYNVKSLKENSDELKVFSIDLSSDLIIEKYYADSFDFGRRATINLAELVTETGEYSITVNIKRRSNFESYDLSYFDTFTFDGEQFLFFEKSVVLD